MFKRVLVFIIGILYLALVLSQVNWPQFVVFWQHIPFVYLACAFIAYTALNGFRTLRYVTFLSKPRVPLHELFFIGVYHNFLVRVLPFKLGEATYVVLLQQRLKRTYSEGISSLIAARLFELFMIIAVLGITVLLDMSEAALSQAMPQLFALFAMGIALVVGFYWSGTILRWLLRYLGRAMPTTLNNAATNFADNLERLREPSRFTRGLVWSLGTYVASFTTNALLLSGLTVEMSLFHLVLAVSIGMFATAFPFNISGFGTVELGWVFALTTFSGYGVAEAATVGLFLNMFQVVCAAALGFVGWIYLSYTAAPH